MPTTIDGATIAVAVEAGIEAASDAVFALPRGQQAWGDKEHMIAETAATAAMAKLRELMR